MSLRPKILKDFVGQQEIKDRIQVSIRAAKSDARQLPHLLLEGPPGTGKTTLASIIADEMEVDIYIANGANLRSIKALMPYLMKVQQHDVFFIDELHRCTPLVMEYLYPVMEDFRVDLGNEDKMTINLAPFTLVGATTEGGTLLPPLYDRFTFKYTLDLYEVDDLATLASFSATKLKVDLTKCGAKALAAASRGTPRIANAYLLWIRDYAHGKEVKASVVHEALDTSGITPDGMCKADRRYLVALKSSRRPLGLKSLAAITSINVDTIENNIEPFLMRMGLIAKTPKGRVAV